MSEHNGPAPRIAAQAADLNQVMAQRREMRLKMIEARAQNAYGILTALVNGASQRHDVSLHEGRDLIARAYELAEEFTRQATERKFPE